MSGTNTTSTRETRAQDVRHGPLLGIADEQALLREYVAEPTPALEEELVRRFTPLARSLALRYRGGVERADDLTQVASLALVKALRGYDPERGRSFKAYAAPTILGELRRHFRDHSWRLHMPRSLQERSLAVERASDALSDELGKSPSVAQIAAHLELEDEDVLDVLQARESQRSVSLDTPARREEPESVPKVETVGGDDIGFDTVEAQLAIERCATLTDQERRAIELRFTEELNQYEIGARMGVSQMQVSRLLRRGLARLLEAVQGDEEPNGRRTFEENGRDPRFPNGRSWRRRRKPAGTKTAAGAASSV
jgi:RNA polymerase sigma-B factor